MRTMNSQDYVPSQNTSERQALNAGKLYRKQIAQNSYHYNFSLDYGK